VGPCSANTVRQDGSPTPDKEDCEACLGRIADINLHWHDLRHEYACRLAERGVPITKIQYLLGHASVVTTERYIHHTLAELSKAAAALERGGVFDALSDPKVGHPVAGQPVGTPSEATQNVH